MKETILLYNIMKPEVLDVYRSICEGEDIALLLVPQEEYAVPIGFLAYGTKEQKAEYITDGSSDSADTRTFSEPMMVFGGFTGPRLTEMLKIFRETGVPGVSLKAMMTEHTAVWDSVTLFEQLAEERDQFARMK